MSIIDALVSDGPYKGWPLGVSIAIGRGEVSPSEAKAMMVAAYERQRSILDQAIESARSLPDEICLA